MVDYLLLIFLSLFLFAISDAQCDSLLKWVNYPHPSRPYYEIDLTDAIKDCDELLRYRVDMDFYDVCDRFTVVIDSSEVLHSEWIGRQCNEFMFEGYLEYTHLANGDTRILFREIPGNFSHGQDKEYGKSRLWILTNSKTPKVRIYPNPDTFSAFAAMAECVDEFQIIGRDTFYVCYEPEDRTGYALVVNCDTLLVDSVHVTHPEIRYDTIYTQFETANDTFYTVTDFGCIVPVLIRHYKLIGADVFIPNVFSPNGDGVNDLFEIPGFVAEITIYDRWGNMVWHGGAWNGGGVHPGVYAYVIKLDGKIFHGNVTVVR